MQRFWLLISAQIAVPNPLGIADRRVEYAHAQSDRVLILAASLAENMPEHVAERLGPLAFPV